MAAISYARAVRISPRKVAIVAALIRGRTIDDALIILSHTPRNSATAVTKAIKSAAANAVHNHNYKSSGLFISEISVTNGPRAKRFRPAAKGSANAFQLKTANIRVVVDGVIRAKEAVKAVKEEEEKK